MINIIGAGLAGMSAACELAERGISCRLVSLQNSERAQSVLAEGGINAALDTMNEHDSPAEHFADTMRGGCYLADPNAVAGLTENAPDTVRKLQALGVPFGLNEKGIILRNFGGQKKKRTAYSKSSTGKILMTALIDCVRKYESRGLVSRFTHHELVKAVITDGKCSGVTVRDCYSGELSELPGQTVLCCGGLNGMFPGRTTGTTQNTADAAAQLFSQGVHFGNLEMLQYHPTTIAIPGKRCLISEAARGEGGRLWIKRKDGSIRYFMEEKYPELGNLMPRDVVSREMFFVRRQEDTAGEVCLDMTGLSPEVWKDKLSDLREEIIRYTGKDPAVCPIPVHEGIHYFMGGISVDEQHRTNISGLYAAGECCCQYHGANRLGGNSMLGAVYGGRVAARTAAAEYSPAGEAFTPDEDLAGLVREARPEFIEQVAEILISGLGIVRNDKDLSQAIERLEKAKAECPREENRKALGLAMLLSARERRESRGAHFREDFPQTLDEYRRQSLAVCRNGVPEISFAELPERRVADAVHGKDTKA